MTPDLVPLLISHVPVLFYRHGYRKENRVPMTINWIWVWTRLSYWSACWVYMESLVLTLLPYKPGFLGLTCNPNPWDGQKFKVILGYITSLRPAWVPLNLSSWRPRTRIGLAGFNLKPPSCNLASTGPESIRQVAKEGRQLKVLSICDTDEPQQWPAWQHCHEGAIVALTCWW